MMMQSVKEPWSERFRLIRFRMNHEKTRFRDELRLVPRSLVIIATVLYVIALVAVVTINATGIGNNGVPWPAGYTPAESALISVGIVTAVALPAACVLFLIGYVNRDAARRGMHATQWTIVVIILLPAWVATGFIIYFLIRDPLPYVCPRCGSSVLAKFNYCPACMYNLHPTCPVCRREVRVSDRYCPYCAADLAANRAVSVSVPPEVQPGA